MDVAPDPVDDFSQRLPFGVAAEPFGEPGEPHPGSVPRCPRFKPRFVCVRLGVEMESSPGPESQSW